jgi:hypothetical protein
MVMTATFPDRNLLTDEGSPTDTHDENRRQALDVGEVHTFGLSRLFVRSPAQYDQTI